MRGSLVHQGKNRWSLVMDLGYVTDPATGKRKRQQKWVSFHGTKKAAEDKLTELARSVNRDEWVEPSKTTLLDYLRKWVERSVKPPMKRPATYRLYCTIIEYHIAKSTVASLPLQKVRGSDLERYYAELKLAPGSVQVHHAVLHSALEKAVLDHLLTRNPAVHLERPRPSRDRAAVREHCWAALEASRFLAAARTAGEQSAAFFALALDTGARKSELHGLLWTDVDLDSGTLSISRQLDKAGVEPVFGVTKTGRTRTLSLGAETVTLLRAHKRHQAELKMANRTTYQDHGLMFAKEAEDLQTPLAALGQPICTLAEKRFKRLIAQAGVKDIKFHGLRHTSITLMLAAGVPVHVVSKRVGHANVSMTLDIYAHALPDQQQDAAARLAAVLHG
jgi:integrase